MRGAIELSNVHHVVLILEDRSLVVVHIKIVGRTKYRHDAREASRSGLAIHSIPSILCFMCPNDGEDVVLFEKIASRWVGEEIRASSDVVVDEVFASLFLAEFFKRICPENVAHKSMGGWLPESVNLFS